MGMIFPGAPKELILRLSKAHDLTHFFETGTFLALTAKWAASHFKQVTTVERSPSFYADAAVPGAGISNLEFVLGDSREVLRQRAASLPEETLFWLDAHYCGGKSYGPGDECPLLDEIRALAGTNKRRFVLIDDARLFLAPPAPHHSTDQWPTIDQVVRELVQLAPDQYIVVFEDVIIAVPARAKAVVKSYCQQALDKPWNDFKYFWATFKNEW